LERQRREPDARALPDTASGRGTRRSTVASHTSNIATLEARQRAVTDEGCIRLERQATPYGPAMDTLRSIVLFALAALAEIGGAWLVWQGVREHRGVGFVGAGIAALGIYGLVATLQPDATFGRILAAYGGIFVAGSLAWGRVVDGYRPDRFDLTGAAICLVGVAVIMYAPRPG
jgi:small multidrug resistance family-3 protein